MFRIESFHHQALTQDWGKISHLTFYASAMIFKSLIFFLPLILLIIFNLIMVDNIRKDLQEVGCGYVDWIGLAQDRDRWRTLVSAVMNLRVP